MKTRSSRRVAIPIALAVAALCSQTPPPLRAQSDEISPSALAQIEALIREKESRAGVALKLDSQLVYAIKMGRGESLALGVSSLETDLPPAVEGKLEVDVTGDVGEALLLQLAANDAEVVRAVPEQRSVRVRVALDKLEAIASLPEVSFVQPRQDSLTTAGPSARVGAMLSAAFSDPGQGDVAGNLPATGQGSRSSEGDRTHRAYSARGTFDVDGTGIKIGVLSNGVANLAASQARGDLGPVTVLPGQAGTGDEGTAMLEIVHDLAPGAQLFFATANNGIASFAQNIRGLRAAGCDIIVDDVFYFVETPFQDGQAPPIVSNTNGGAVIQAVNDVTAEGALYFSSAGNSGNVTDGTAGAWEGDFVDGGPTAAPLSPAAGRLHNFGGQSFDVVTVPPAATTPINLYWSDPLGGSANDYDLFRLNPAGSAVAAASTNLQTGTQDPYEQVSSGAVAGARIVVVKKTAAAPRFLHLNTNRGRLSIATIGQTHGHSHAAEAFSTAATPAVGPFPNAFSAANVSETFTSDGPRRIFFAADGTPITPGDFSAGGGLLRQKPDITAADGVSVTGVGGFPSPFFGTSAAAPHAAAIAGLIKSANPAFTPAQIRTALASTAIDIEAPGVDRDTGAGIIDAFAALQALGVPGTANLELAAVDALENPGNGNAALDAGEGVRLELLLKNTGVAAATALQATLATSTPGITLTLPNGSPYVDLAALTGSATSSSPLRFTIASSAGCPLTADFTLAVSYSGGPSPRLFSFSVPTGPAPLQFSSLLTAAPPPAGAGFTTAAGLQNNRLFRSGIASQCASPKAFPGLGGAGARQFHAYTITTCANSVPSCATVSMSSTPVGSNPSLFTAAYGGSFDPNNIATNYLADAGVSNVAGGNVNYSFALAGGAQTFVIDVHEVFPGLGVNVSSYDLRLSGACAGSCDPPNQVPVAKAKDVTVSAGPDCTADASIDDGSFDPDGDPLLITQSPPGPYSLGTTSVLLTVADPKGATSQASASVTVVDTTPPSVTGVSASPSSLWPPNHKMVDVTILYEAADNCSAVHCTLSVTSSEPAAGDWEIVDAHHVRLRAERHGGGAGRVYTIAVTCQDAAGGTTVKTVPVVVRHDQGH